MAILIAVQEIVFARYPQGYEKRECDVEGIAYNPEEMEEALKEFVNCSMDAELKLTTTDGAEFYLLRQYGMLFMRSKNLDEEKEEGQVIT